MGAARRGGRQGPSPLTFPGVEADGMGPSGRPGQHAWEGLGGVHASLPLTNAMLQADKTNVSVHQAVRTLCQFRCSVTRHWLPSSLTSELRRGGRQGRPAPEQGNDKQMSEDKGAGCAGKVCATSGLLARALLPGETKRAARPQHREAGARGVKAMAFEVPQAWAQILAPPLVRCVTLDKLFHLTCQVGKRRVPYSDCGFGGSKKMMRRKDLT